MPDESEPSEAELIEHASKELVESLQSAVRIVDTTGFEDVDPKTVLKAKDEPDFAFINTYRTNPMTGRQMRVKVFFGPADDPMLGMAYKGALRNPMVSREARDRYEMKLWRACVTGPPEVLMEEWHRKSKPQSRAELTAHCLTRLGLENPRLSGLGQDAFVPAGNLVNSSQPVLDVAQETPAAPANPQSAPPTNDPVNASKPTQMPSTASATSTTSPGGTEFGPRTFSVGGPPARSKRPGSVGKPPASRSG